SSSPPTADRPPREACFGSNLPRLASRRVTGAVVEAARRPAPISPVSRRRRHAKPSANFLCGAERPERAPKCGLGQRCEADGKAGLLRLDRVLVDPVHRDAALARSLEQRCLVGALRQRDRDEEADRSTADDGAGKLTSEYGAGEVSAPSVRRSRTPPVTVEVAAGDE